MREDTRIFGLSDLQLALLEDDNDAIKGFLESMDRVTANDALRRAGARFGFPTTEINGVVYTSGTHMAAVFGYKDARGLQKLLERRGIEGIKVGGFVHSVRILQDELHLEPNDFKTLLYDWSAFLVGGMNSQNPEARLVQAYLLKMEKVARVALTSGLAREGFSDRALKLQPRPGFSGVSLPSLCRQANKGCRFSARALDWVYGMPVEDLMEDVFTADPDTSETASLIARYLHELMTETNAPGIERTADALTGTTKAFMPAFEAISRARALPKFFNNTYSFGAAVSRERDALEALGWRKEHVKKMHGENIYRFRKTGMN